MKNILFRADSSSTIGTGHIMRDLVLASQYKDSNIIFATQKLDGNINAKIKEAGYKVKTLKSNSLKEVTQLVEKQNIDLIVIDHYGIDYKYEKKLKDKTDVKILSFDDTYEKHHCDILLNHNISANKKRYKDLVPEGCELRCGSEFTLIRDEFIKEKKKKEKLVNTENKTIFLAMGGADHSNINIKILKVIEKFDNLKVNLVTTTANANLKELKKYVKNREWINLHVNSNKIAKLMKKSDASIITPSVILNEIYFMQVPFIAITTAINQKDMYKYLKKQNFLVLNKFNKEKLKQSINKILKSLG
ncbi:UDP-2,4-diacetamido-2,4,6-trideoxy-beta-L-altropyranose hydrolase [Sulfurimonas sp.]|nr:UDP-2,4-diacetamido-2,4,6-trideoxy-beta-L-altropyranose hydrolase [Sulfurimonas sp.]